MGAFAGLQLPLYLSTAFAASWALIIIQPSAGFLLPSLKIQFFLHLLARFNASLVSAESLPCEILYWGKGFPPRPLWQRNVNGLMGGKGSFPSTHLPADLPPPTKKVQNSAFW